MAISAKASPVALESAFYGVHPFQKKKSSRELVFVHAQIAFPNLSSNEINTEI